MLVKREDTDMEKTMEKIVALAKTEVLYIQVLRSMAVLQIPGITVIWALS